MLRDRIVCGINNATIQARLLDLPDLTFKVAVQTALAVESAKKDAGELCQAGEGILFTHKVGNTAQNTSCYRCGDRGQLAPQCRHIDSKCHYCQKKGHLLAV
ncbi:hypothetical protein ISCGN_007771 [Ixodes scapularis]